MIGKKSKIFVAGHNGMVGSALVRLLKKKNIDLIVKEKKELNLLNQKQVNFFFKSTNEKFTKEWKPFEKLFDKKNISRKECILLPFKTVTKALKS